MELDHENSVATNTNESVALSALNDRLKRIGMRTGMRTGDLEKLGQLDDKSLALVAYMHSPEVLVQVRDLLTTPRRLVLVPGDENNLFAVAAATVADIETWRIEKLKKLYIIRCNQVQLHCNIFPIAAIAEGHSFGKILKQIAEEAGCDTKSLFETIAYGERFNHLSGGHRGFLTCILLVDRVADRTDWAPTLVEGEDGSTDSDSGSTKDILRDIHRIFEEIPVEKSKDVWRCMDSDLAKALCLIGLETDRVLRNAGRPSKDLMRLAAREHNYYTMSRDEFEQLLAPWMGKTCNCAKAE